MVKFLDARTSQNDSTSSASGPMVTATPVLFGSLGLSTAGAGPNLRVQFTATIGISSVASLGVPITISIFRGTGTGAVLVYRATEQPVAAGAAGALNRRIITVTGSDYQPPNPGFLIYQAFVNTEGGVAIAPTRTGPESFNASAYSD